MNTNEIVLFSSGDKRRVARMCNFVISNGLLGDEYLHEFDGVCITACPINTYISRDRITIELVGEYSEYTDNQMLCLKDTILTLMRRYGTMRISRREDYEEGIPTKELSISNKALINLNKQIKTSWIKGE